MTPEEFRAAAHELVDWITDHRITVEQRRVRPEHRAGDIVAALVGDEATVKTLRIRRRKIVLEPANPDFEPIVPEPGAVRVLGKVIEIRRRVG